MKPLPSVDPNPGRHKAPVAAIVENRDEKRFNYFDRKTGEKRKNEANQMNTQAKIAKNALDWDKAKHNTAGLEAKKAEAEKVRLESELTDKKISWEREKFTKDDLRLVKAEEDRVEQERIKTRREIMEACNLKGMSIQETKEYMELLFAK
jgi:hypothetical protein